MSFIKCECGKLLNIENEKHIGVSIYNSDITNVQSCFLVKECFDLEEVRKSIKDYLDINNLSKVQIKFKDKRYKDTVSFKRISKDKCKVTVGIYSVIVDREIILNKFI